MKNILDKIKVFLKNIGEKMTPIFEKVVEFVKKHKRYFAVGCLFLVMILVLVFFAGKEFNQKRIAKQNSIEVSGEKYVPDKKFKVDAYKEVNQLIKSYFDAYVVADIEKLDSLATPLSDMEKSYISMMSQFYEKYQNIKCYTKQGLSKDSYIVTVCFDIKFVNQEVTAPSMLLFYVQTNKEGDLYINNLYSDFNMKYSENKIDQNVYTALRKYTTQDDYLKLYHQVESDYQKIIKENKEIYQLTKRLIPAIRQFWEDGIFYVENTELTQTEDGTNTSKNSVSN